jgi:hypothetical protein
MVGKFPAGRVLEEVALKIGHDENLNKVAGALNESKRNVDHCPIALKVELERLLTPDEIEMLPMQGSTREDVAGTNDLYDVYKGMRLDPVKGKVAVRTSFYKELARKIDAGKAWDQRWDELRHSKSARYKAEANECSKAIQLIAKNLGMAVSLIKQLKLMEQSKTCRASLRTDKDASGKTVYSKYNKPIVFRSIEQEDLFEALSIPQFLSMNIKLALANGDDYHEFMDTLRKRGMSDRISTFSEFAATVSKLDWYMSNHYDLIAAEVAKTDNDDLLWSLNEIRDVVGRLFANTKIPA